MRDSKRTQRAVSSLKLRYADFGTINRILTTREATNLDDRF